MKKIKTSETKANTMQRRLHPQTVARAAPVKKTGRNEKMSVNNFSLGGVMPEN
jgi:hypothetical protein